MEYGNGINLVSIPSVYTYSNDSLYTIELIAANQNYCFDTISAQVDILETPDIDIMCDVASCAKAIQFGTSDIASSYYWDFGDGSNSILKEPTHNFVNSGLYEVYLYATNGNCIDTTHRSITIYDLPDAEFFCTENCSDTIQLLHAANNNYQYSWTFGDGGFSIDPLPQHVYLNEGNFEITLTVTDSNNCVDSSSVDAYSIFDGDFEVDFYLDSCEYTYYFAVSDSLNPVFCDFGDDKSAVGISLHQYQFSGSKNIKLIRRYQSVCADTVEINLDVPFDLDQQLYLPNSFTPNNDGKNDVFEMKSIVNCVDFKISIYNKWGQRIFLSTDIGFKWDGLYEGDKSPEGLYVYKIERKTRVDSDKIGFVFLVR